MCHAIHQVGACSGQELFLANLKGDAEYIAVCSPDRISRLITQLEAYEGALEAIASRTLDTEPPYRYAPEEYLAKSARAVLARFREGGKDAR
jgi:hypothetical protein